MTQLLAAIDLAGQKAVDRVAQELRDDPNPPQQEELTEETDAEEQTGA